VAAIAAIGAHPDDAKRQIRIVVHNDDFRWAQTQLVRNASKNGIADDRLADDSQIGPKSH
jgi:hypothetical protein